MKTLYKAKLGQEIITKLWPILDEKLNIQKPKTNIDNIYPTVSRLIQSGGFKKRSLKHVLGSKLSFGSPKASFFSNLNSRTDTLAKTHAGFYGNKSTLYESPNKDWVSVNRPFTTINRPTINSRFSEKGNDINLPIDLIARKISSENYNQLKFDPSAIIYESNNDNEFTQKSYNVIRKDYNIKQTTSKHREITSGPMIFGGQSRTQNQIDICDIEENSIESLYGMIENLPDK